MRIVDLKKDEMILVQMAEVLYEGFRGSGSEGLESLEKCRKGVDDIVERNPINRLAVEEGGEVLGFTSGSELYKGYTWELELLVVRPDVQLRGIGAGLLRDFEENVFVRGGSVVFLGTDDENSRTSLGGKELYPDALQNLIEIKDVGGHPFQFYQKMGYEIVGLLPDANGFGKPDIFMAKRLFANKGDHGKETS